MYFKNTVLASGCDILKDAGIPNYVMSAEQLLMFVLGVDRSTMIMTTNITDKQYEDYMNCIERRKNREPLDRIIGSLEFLDITIPYSDNVLTPRCETEILADIVINDIGDNKVSILDLCCGSGCIGLSIAHNCNCDVTLVDISREALAEAQNNYNYNVAKGKEFSCQPHFVLSDMFDNVHDTYDIIISNPPYIPSLDCQTLEKEVTDYDPLLALDGGEDGLDFYRIIAKNGSNYLKENGKIYLEIGIGQREDIENIFDNQGFETKVIPDYSGIDRFIIAKKREIYVK